MKTILVVEDNPKIAKAIGARLKHHGFAVRIAYDAPSAVMLARKHEPDVAILDISIPGGNGLDLAENLKINICERDLPIIFVTANKDPVIKSRAEMLHAAAFLEKPFSAKQLVDAIDHALLAPQAEMTVAEARHC